MQAWYKFVHVNKILNILYFRSSEILNPEGDHEKFFSCVVALSAHFIGLNVSSCK